MKPSDIFSMFDDWSVVPNAGAIVAADHPITVLNPDPVFEVTEVECRNSRWYARGEATMWFSIGMLRPRTVGEWQTVQDARMRADADAKARGEAP